MRRKPSTLAIVLARATLSGYLLVVLFYVLGVLFPGVNPDPAQWFYIPPLWYVAGLGVFPLSFVCALLTGITSLVVLLRAKRRGWSVVYGAILLLFASATLFSIGTVLSGRGVLGGVQTTIGLGIAIGASLILLPVLTLAAFSPERAARA
jgi:hypothetical protein